MGLKMNIQHRGRRPINSFLFFLLLMGCAAQKQYLPWYPCSHVCQSGLIKGDRPDAEFYMAVTRELTMESANFDGINVSEFRAGLCRTLRPADEKSLSENFIRVFLECDGEKWFIDKLGNVEINGMVDKLDASIAIPYFEGSSCDLIPEWARADIRGRRAPRR
jgi:hypothetical protein